MMSNAEAEAIPNRPSTTAANADELLDDPIRRCDNLSHASLMTYAIMLGLLVLALFAAIGHHLFYSFLDNCEIDKAAIPQTWAIRIGNAFAYLFKTVLVAAVAKAYAQGFWFFVRRKSFEIGSLDNFFGILYNPLLFYNADFLQKTTLLFGLAAVSWLLPISAVFAPGSLTGRYLAIRIS